MTILLQPFIIQTITRSCCCCQNRKICIQEHMYISPSSTVDYISDTEQFMSRSEAITRQGLCSPTFPQNSHPRDGGHPLADQTSASVLSQVLNLTDPLTNPGMNCSASFIQSLNDFLGWGQAPRGFIGQRDLPVTEGDWQWSTATEILWVTFTFLSHFRLTGNICNFIM